MRKGGRNGRRERDKIERKREREGKYHMPYHAVIYFKMRENE